MKKENIKILMIILFAFLLVFSIALNTYATSPLGEELTAIDTVDITIPVPTVGTGVTAERFDGELDGATQEPQLAITIPEDAHYDYDREGPHMVWLESFEEGRNLFVGEITYNTDYYISVVLNANEGYYFANNVEVTVNGKRPANAQVVNENNTLRIDAVLTTPDDLKAINTVDITIPVPTVGTEVIAERFDGELDGATQEPQLAITIPEDAHYDYDREGPHMVWLESFEEGRNLFVGEITYNTDYYISVVLNANEGYYFANNVEVTVNGKRPANAQVVNENNTLLIDVVLTTPEEQKESIYTILEGENQTYNEREVNGITIKASGEIDKFTGLKVDDNVLDTSKYNVVSGSTVVTLKTEYLNTLSSGTHKLTFVYEDGEVSTNFKVEKTEQVEQDEKQSTEKNDFEDATTIKGTLPQTGLSYTGIIIFSMILLLSSITFYIKYKK